MENIFYALINIGSAFLFTVLAIPLYKEKVKMNSLYGVKFPQSYKSDEKWYRINKYGAKRMIIWSVPIFTAGIIILFLPPLQESTALIVSMLPLLILIPMVESYLYARKI